MTLLHICRPDEWQAAQPIGEYCADSLATEGFIHCSTPAQAADTANTHFAGQSNLILLVINVPAVRAAIKYELAPNGNTYPHIYGPLNTNAVYDVVPLPCNPDGTFTLPTCLKTLCS